MPSPEWMQKVLGQDPSAETEPDQEEVEDDQTDEQPEGGQEADAPEDDQGQPEEETEPEGEAVEYEEAGSEEEESPEEYESPEVLRKRVEDARAWGNERARLAAEAQAERDQALQTLAYLQGQMEATRQESGEGFNEWAEGHLERDPQQGMAEARQYGAETGDWAPARAYADLWGERDPYNASQARVYIDLDEAMQNRASAREPTEHAQAVEANKQVISQAWNGLKVQYPDLAEGNETLGGTVEILRQDQFLNEMVRSGDPGRTQWAIENARARYIASRPRRRVLANEQQLASEKLAGTVSNGEGNPNGRSKVVEIVPEEFQDSMAYFEKHGMLRKE